MTDREKNIGVRVGDTIVHCNRVFTIVDINCEEHVEGMVFTLRAFDPDMANREQQKAISMDQTKNQVLEMIKKMTEGGGHGGIGFGIGG